MHEAILKPSSEAQNSFRIKSHIGEDTGQFSAGPVNKAHPSFRNSSTDPVKGNGRHSEHIALLKKVLTLLVFALS